MRRYQINGDCWVIELNAVEWLCIKLFAVTMTAGAIIGALLAVAHPSFGDVLWIQIPD